MSAPPLPVAASPGVAVFALLVAVGGAFGSVAAGVGWAAGFASAAVVCDVPGCAGWDPAGSSVALFAADRFGAVGGASIDEGAEAASCVAVLLGVIDRCHCGITCGIVAGMKQVQLRLPDELAEAIDARAERVGMSRHAWLVKALQWAVEQPTRVQTVKERI